MDTSKAPELKAQMGVFEKTLKKLGPVTIKQLPVDTEDKPQYRTGAGLSSRRFLRIIKKSASANAIVSFIGAPRGHLDSPVASCGFRRRQMIGQLAAMRSRQNVGTLCDKLLLKRCELAVKRQQEIHKARWQVHRRIEIRRSAVDHHERHS